MIIVIQCAASKRANAGRLTTATGKPVEFVADPAAAPSDPARLYARPDDLPDTGISWREVLLKYNREAHDNPLGLCPAYQLYENKVYGRLADRFGVPNLYILSAGWGLIRADFLTPHYDITFSQSADAYKRRKKTDRVRVRTKGSLCVHGRLYKNLLVRRRLTNLVCSKRGVDRSARARLTPGFAVDCSRRIEAAVVRIRRDAKIVEASLQLIWDGSPPWSFEIMAATTCGSAF